AFFFVGVGVAVYGLPLVPAVVIIGTLIWTCAEIIGGPAVFAYPAMAGPADLEPHYIRNFPVLFGPGSAGRPGHRRLAVRGAGPRGVAGHRDRVGARRDLRLRRRTAARERPDAGPRRRRRRPRHGQRADGGRIAVDQCRRAASSVRERVPSLR